MKLIRRAVRHGTYALVGSAAAVAALLVIAACSSSGDDAANGSTSSAYEPCSDSTLTVLFAPMYSAYDGSHQFQIPAIVDGLAKGKATWSVSDSSLVAFEPDDTNGGIMLTTQKAGKVTVVARAGNLCGASELTITEASPDDYDVGKARYNDGTILRPGPRQGADAGNAKQAACTNCHGSTANGAFKDVAHTPQQTGGFSDDELIGIFTKGEVPTGGYFDDAIVAYDRWQQFHKWEMTDEQAKGMVVYLRGLTPTPQEGSANFGGRFADGGRPPHGRRDAGPPLDAQAE